VADRRIAFEQVFNFRDLGGYRARDARTVRWGTLFRADGLNRLQPGEEAAFAALGISTVIDLRTNEEAEHGGRFPAEVWDVAYHHLPMFDVLPDWPEEIVDPADYLSERYLEMFATGRKAVARAFELLADQASYPLVFHCTAGKDRTGILAALVLAVLGVPDDVIATDYALSQEAMGRLVAWAREQQGVFARPRGTIPSIAVEARPGTIVAFLGKLRARGGSEDGFLAEIGVSAADAGTIRRLLLEA
jgi:protein tyrosine/serine phosphatase